MAVLGTLVNLLDMETLLDPGGREVLPMIKSMAEMQDILQDIPIIEGNGRHSHKYLRNVGLTTPEVASYNAGLTAQKGRFESDIVEYGMYESRLQIDRRFRKEPNFDALVARSAYPHWEGIAQAVCDAIVLGSTSGGHPFNGIEAHLHTAGMTDQAGNTMIHTYGGSSTVTSILAVDWGADKIYGVHPEGHSAYGAEVLAESADVLVADSNSKDMWAYVIDFGWYLALCIADDRCVRRIANIEPVGSSNNPLASTFSVYPIMEALNSMYNMGRGAVLYMNRTMWTVLWKAAKSDTTVNYQAANPWQRPEYLFGENRVRFTDSILNSESQVTTST